MKGDLIMDKDKINQLLERLGGAISSNDLKDVSACWTFPAMFLSDKNATVIADANQLEMFMAQAVEAYRKQGIASGKEKASERSHYILHMAEDGQAHIRVSLTRTK